MKPLLTALGLLACAAAHAQTVTVLDPGSTFAYMPNWCGGTQLNEYALGFDAAHNPVALVTDSTVCSSGGRGSRPRVFFACYRVTFQNGVILSREQLLYTSWPSYAAPTPCPVVANLSAQYDDGNQTLSTVAINPGLFRAVLVTP